MNADALLQWHYLVFLLPFGVATLMLLLSSVRLGHRPMRHGGHARPHAAHRTHTSHHAHRAHHAKAAHGKPGAKTGSKANERSGLTASAAMTALLGVGQVPLSLWFQTFCIGWGFTGYWLHRLLAKMPEPSLGDLLPVFLGAAGGGWLGARFAAFLFARVLPQEETFVVSQQELFGLTGNVAFPVTETSGRIRIYDDNGTLHDEMCRVTPGTPTIEKGRRALVMDMDTDGRLVVEEVPATD